MNDITIEAINKDTIIDKLVYHVYEVKQINTYIDGDADTSFYYTYRHYLREDTLSKKVFFYGGEVAFDFSDEANRGEITPFYTWREMNITKPDSLIIAGEYFKRWQIQNIADNKVEYFYKAIGIGSFAGILYENSYRQEIGQVLSLDFVYKGDSIHFDYPLQ